MYLSQVQVTDNGIYKKSSVARVFIKVIPVPMASKHAPNLIHKNMTVRVTENDPAGFLVAVIQATDEDDDHLWYKIIGKNVWTTCMRGRCLFMYGVQWDKTV